jgi:hypothetical protein
MHRSAFLNSVLDQSGQLRAPAALPPKKEPSVLIGWAPESVCTLWRREKFCPTGNRTQAIARPTELIEVRNKHKESAI